MSASLGSSLSFRRVHGWLSLGFGLVFVLVAVTGMLFAGLSAWTSLPRTTLKPLLQVHQMSILGIQAFFVPVVAALLAVQLATGLVLQARRLARLGVWGTLWPRSSSSLSSSGIQVRGVHASFALLGGALAMAVMGLSGAVFRVLRAWGGWSAADARWWLDLHIGKAVAETRAAQFVGLTMYWPWYPLAMGSWFLATAATGMYLTWKQQTAQMCTKKN